jgi:hypothetical protein
MTTDTNGILNGNDSLQVRYEPADNNKFLMDAKLESNSAIMQIEALNFISKSLHVKSSIRTTSLGEGSLIRYYLLQVHENLKDEDKFMASLVLQIFLMFFSRKELFSLEEIIQNMGIEYENIKPLLIKRHITENVINQLLKSKKLHNHRSKFYNGMKEDKEIHTFEITTGKNFTFPKETVKQVESKEFELFVEDLTTTDDITDDEAEILIVKPVLMKNNESKWAGYYKDEPINFSLKSSEFKTKVQIGDIDFHTGIAIQCRLTYTHIVNENNEVSNSNYVVEKVYNIFDDNKQIQTLEGKKKKIDDEQPNLFPDMLKK